MLNAAGHRKRKRFPVADFFSSLLKVIDQPVGLLPDA